MTKMIKILLVTILLLVLIVALYIGGNILYATITDYQPEAIEPVEVKNEISTTAKGDAFSLVIWNIGYGGLGEQEDFFYDGGKGVVPPQERVKENLSGIYQTIEGFKNYDFVLLQEVDLYSKRSNYTNEVEAIAGILENYCYAFATNYKVKFVPMPLTVPPWNAMGKVTSGLASYSKYNPVASKRYSFPGNFSWPTRVYFLDRCFLLQRFELNNNKQLIVINTHNSAYDDGTLKAQQMEYLKGILLDEYDKGNYVIVGGDWNQCPPGFDFETFGKDEDQSYQQINVSKDYLPAGWQWAYDENVPTNRKLATPYEHGKTFTTLIDFYLLSPNVKIISVNGVDLRFKFSDHQPVALKIELN